jgi:hypothetical protein
MGFLGVAVKGEGDGRQDTLVGADSISALQGNRENEGRRQETGDWRRDRREKRHPGEGRDLGRHGDCL